MWLDHLHTIKENRKRGTAKAAETRRRKKESNSSAEVLVSSEHNNQDKTYCGMCHQEYQNFTENVEEWIECDLCDRWYHFTCVGIVEVPDTYICDPSVNKFKYLL